MVITVPKVGAPCNTDDLGQEHIEIWKKATTGGSRIEIGRVAVLNPTTNICAEATTGSFGRFGVVYSGADNYDSLTRRGNLDTDASDKVVVLTNGARCYVTLGGTIPGNSEVMAGATGRIVLYVETTWSSTTPADFQGPLREDMKKVGVYEGHYGESLQAAGEPPTQGINNDIGILHIRSNL